jgi:phosphoglycerate dehydrogenase-like enzyme
MRILVTMPKGGIFDSFMPPSVQEQLEKLGEVEYNPTSTQFTPDELRKRLRGKDVVVTGWGVPNFDENIIQGNDSLKIIAHTGGSVQCVASDAVYNSSIRVLSGNAIYAESVAEGVVAYMLAALRKIPHFVNSMRDGEWDKVTKSEGLLEQRVGLVGYGMVAKNLIRMLKMFRCNILVHSSHISDEELRESGLTRATLDEIFSTCKIVSLHSSLTPKTYHMIDRRLLEMIDRDSILINTARGGIIDEEALTELLKQNRFRAVLDVYEEEPLPDNSPLRSFPNVYALPHKGGPTYDRRKLVTMALIEDIKSFFTGQPLQCEITSAYAKHMTQESIK